MFLPPWGVEVHPLHPGYAYASITPSHLRSAGMLKDLAVPLRLRNDEIWTLTLRRPWSDAVEHTATDQV